MRWIQREHHGGSNYMTTLRQRRLNVVYVKLSVKGPDGLGDGHRSWLISSLDTGIVYIRLLCKSDIYTLDHISIHFMTTTAAQLGKTFAFVVV
jgi:hypothetical protein